MQKGREVAEKFKMEFGIVSAKTDHNVKEAINGLIVTVLKEKIVLPLKSAFLSFLLHINEDFDDDLLQEAIELLT
jgi:hypothetical protein